MLRRIPVLLSARQFSALQIFNKDCRRYMRRLWRDVGNGKIKPKLDAQELDLDKNPRRVR